MKQSPRCWHAVDVLGMVWVKQFEDEANGHIASRIACGGRDTQLMAAGTTAVKEQQTDTQGYNAPAHFRCPTLRSASCARSAAADYPQRPRNDSQQDFGASACCQLCNCVAPSPQDLGSPLSCPEAHRQGRPANQNHHLTRRDFDSATTDDIGDDSALRVLGKGARKRKEEGAYTLASCGQAPPVLPCEHRQTPHMRQTRHTSNSRCGMVGHLCAKDAASQRRV